MSEQVREVLRTDGYAVEDDGIAGLPVLVARREGFLRGQRDLLVDTLLSRALAR